MDHAIPTAVLRQPDAGLYGVKNESMLSGVSWAAVTGGAFVAAAMALILLALGAGLGLTSVSPWSGVGASAATIGVATIVWLVLMQVISSSLGGYVAGRLRTKWVDVHTDEVYFRDTAHGFLVWAVGLVIGAALLGSAASSLVGAAMETGEAAVATAATGAGAAAASSNTQSRSGSPASEGTAYFVDSLFRANGPADNSNATAGNGSGTPVDTTIPNTNGTSTTSTTSMSTTPTAGFMRGADANTRGEVVRILANGLSGAEFPAADKIYLTQLVASRTGMSQAEAERRVTAVLAQAQQAKATTKEKADEARKAAAHLAFWTFFALLCGAFAASFSATIGGRQRDAVVHL
jgi:hypothetical protein